MSIYDIKVTANSGKEISMSQYKGDIMLIVNTASKCGFTPQYYELQGLYEMYQDKGFHVLAFPSNQFLKQEPGTNREIKIFCDLNYNITFPIFEKIQVKGSEVHPLYKHLTESVPGIFNSLDIKWNFTKFLVDQNGNVVKRYAPITKPYSIKADIERLMN